MITKQLFYEDAYLRSCEAVVLECRALDDAYGIVLDQTCFYPEGGGQPGDIGTLNDVSVFDTQERDGRLFHYTKEPIEAGGKVLAVPNWERRFDYMQQHSGEHIISGIVHSLYQYENVGFHMGADVTTIDFSGVLSYEQLKDIEERANRLIWSNAKIKAWYPEAEELKEIPYRSKKELTGKVRLVQIPEADICACCGIHVDRTGEIGLVKILNCEKFHGGVRLEIVCGLRAVNYLNRIFEQNRSVSQLLSARPLETAKAAADLSEEHNKKRQRIYELEEELFRKTAEEYKGAGDCLIFLDGLDPDGVRRACDAVQNTCKGRSAVFSGNDTDGYKYAVGHPGGDLREFVKTMNSALNGRGGGRPAFVQGNVNSSKEAICAFFEKK